MAKTINDTHKIETSKKSTRKYPNVIWFPRSKTDPREIREVLKLALQAEEENPDKFFNDKTLGVKMARIGSINVIGLGGAEYIESYEGKNTADVSYITNARMLMRLFRFLGFVTRLNKGKYVVTDLGRLYCTFNADFPSYKNGVSEEKVLLDSLANFAFYCVNDDSSFRDAKFRIRPFYWLINTLCVEPQCIYQLIVTTFASQSEKATDIKRIKSLLDNLRSGNTNLKIEWEKVGLAPDDYSCVHNFYDSAKILVYLGVSLGLIEKVSDPVYGKKISGNARNLKQATIFYRATEKGKDFVQINSENNLVYYDELYAKFGESSVISASLLLASLNFRLGNKIVTAIDQKLFVGVENLDLIISKLSSDFGISVIKEKTKLVLKTPVSFSFFQSIPPEIFHKEVFLNFYKNFMNEINNKDLISTEEIDHRPTSGSTEYLPVFQLDDSRVYQPSDDIQLPVIEESVKYEGMDAVFGGSDRFSSRVSPTATVIVEGGKILVNNSIDALDLLVPLRLRDPKLSKFIEENTIDLVNNFLRKSDTWEKDQHYTWVRNCFRNFNMESTYSGSGGMLSRADVTVITPMVAGIEAKSPRENRGTLNLKAIRQAVEAKVQVMEKIKAQEGTPSVAIAIGRRVSTLAVNAEKSWSKQGQPVLLLTDAILYYIVIKSGAFNFSIDSLIKFFTSNHGQITQDRVFELFKENCNDENYLLKIKGELAQLESHFKVED